MKVVISQSMYFPWVGLLEQIRQADIFTHYDDVQFTRGFYNRVQVKTARGMQWLTVPLRDQHRGQLISEVMVDESSDWRSRHLDVLKQAYVNAPYCEEMLTLVEGVFKRPISSLADVSRNSIVALAEYFELTQSTRFVCSQETGVFGSSSQRLCDLCVALDGDIYVTGHGARNYLNHQIFENKGIEVRYMKYNCAPYPQLNGAFTPYVTGLDLVANCGKEGRRVIQSEAINWKAFINGSD
ncbi:WbqC family protein [Herminiimonas contaminans]|uniref:WbqC family protein n=1 Tax=Herminiimonas contaminans TaxID=1111140 RepID=A0ABS0EP91_9BURK|nr:WbqC family protein [Herminiimonas contaminans]MBF8176679.1 WbqC family protein [Herminiimonas contaminans]